MIGLGLEETLLQYVRAVGWSVTAAAVGFAFGVGIALKVFDWLSTDIDEWAEIKKGNIGVSLIFISLIVTLPTLRSRGEARGVLPSTPLPLSPSYPPT